MIEPCDISVQECVKKGMSYKFFKKCRLYFAILIIISAVLSSLVRGLTPWVVQYQENIETYLSDLLGHKVVIGNMQTGWYWFEPVIKLNDLGVFNQYYSVFQARHLALGINLFSSLWHWQLEPGILYLDQVHLTLRQVDDHWQVDGLFGQTDDKTFHFFDNPQLLAWLFAEQKLILKNIKLDIYLNDGTLIPIHRLNLVIHNHYGHYKVKGTVRIEQERPTILRLIADLNIDPKALDRAKGEIYFSGRDIQLAQWRPFLKGDRFQILDGLITGKSWLTFNRWIVTDVQSKINVKSFVGLDTQLKKHLRIDSLNGNWAWQKEKAGWQLSADGLDLIFKGYQWPMNELIIRYGEADHHWEVDVKHIVIDSLLALNWQWPESIKPLIDAKLHGVLQDTQIHIQENQVTQVLSHFLGVGWDAFAKYPTVKNLSGVLHWQPKEWRLAMDGQDTLIQPKGKPAVTLTDLNGAIVWQALDEGWRLLLERLVIRHPDLVISADGVLNNPGPPELRTLQLNAALTGEHVQQWLKYIPAKRLKPKLDAWLRHSIPRLDKLVADVTINGKTADFPFDQAPGEFEVNAHLSGLDLFFAPHWPLTTDIDAYLKVNKRLLTTDIVHANLQKIPLQSLNLSIADLGLNHETMLVHGVLQTEGPKALSYLQASPLAQKLSVLSLLKIQGLLDLDLQLEVPLYPANDTILTLGDMHFKDTTLKVQHRYRAFEFKHFDGHLAFDGDGILDSSFTANMMKTPVAIRMHSTRGPKPATIVNILGQFKLQHLQQGFNLPTGQFMDGTLKVNSELVMPYQTGDLEQVHLSSSLLGTSVHIPPPLNKLATTKSPLTVDLDFSQPHVLHLLMNYDNRLQTDLLFKEEKGQFVIQGGDVRVGSMDTKAKTAVMTDGVKLVAVLAELDWASWKTFFDQCVTPGADQSLMQFLKGIELKIKQIQLAGQDWHDLSLNAKLAQGHWLVDINQANLAGHLSFDTKNRQLKGELSKLYWLKNVSKTEGKNTTFSALKVADLPNIDLKITDFQFKTWQLGALNITATNHPTHWSIDTFHLEAPYYAVDLEGDWQQSPAVAAVGQAPAKNAVNRTSVKSYLNIKNLAKSLEQLGISPVVDSKHGDITLDAQWSGGFHDFDLSAAQGNAALTFKEGLISHFDAATEEKLGLGKLLSILSLQTIPRRLKLDFSDLVHGGYDFDIFRGHFDLKNGSMNTSDAFIDGPVASATIKGNLDVVHQLYDLELRISPHITASLPVVATIAGGPLVGAATWLASKIINQTMLKIYAYSYTISGPWKDPVIKQKALFKNLSGSH